jgi:Zn-dependent peptidase ImmA (M78 family)
LNSYHDLLCIAHAMGLQVVEAIIEDDRLGSYQHNRRRITLDERLTDNQKRVTLQHEIIHAEHWHDGIAQLLSHDVEEQKTRRETALRLIDPQEYAHAEETYDACPYKIADELGVTVNLVEDYRKILEGMAELYKMIQR